MIISDTDMQVLYGFEIEEISDTFFKNNEAIKKIIQGKEKLRN